MIEERKIKEDSNVIINRVKENLTDSQEYQNEDIWISVKDKWEKKYGKDSKIIFDTMSLTERDYIIKNCL